MGPIFQLSPQSTSFYMPPSTRYDRDVSPLLSLPTRPALLLRKATHLARVVRCNSAQSRQLLVVNHRQYADRSFRQIFTFFWAAPRLLLGRLLGMEYQQLGFQVQEFWTMRRQGPSRSALACPRSRTRGSWVAQREDDVLISARTTSPSSPWVRSCSGSAGYGFNGGSAFGANLRATMACWNSCRPPCSPPWPGACWISVWPR